PPATSNLPIPTHRQFQSASIGCDGRNPRHADDGTGPFPREIVCHAPLRSADLTGAFLVTVRRACAEQVLRAVVVSNRPPCKVSRASCLMAGGGCSSAPRKKASLFL